MMSGRNTFATPTNVYPKNGAALVFNNDNKAVISFTNNTDSAAFIKYTIHDLMTGVSRSTFCRWYNEARFARISNRGDIFKIPIERGFEIWVDENKDGLVQEDELHFLEYYKYGRHYALDITTYSCTPRDVDGETILFPNCNVKFSSGEIYAIISSTKIKVSPGIPNIMVPTYWDSYIEDGVKKDRITEYPEMGKNYIGCCYLNIEDKQYMITSYDEETGEMEVFSELSSWISTGTHFTITCNYINSSGSSSEGAYDFYVRHKIQQESWASPVPWGFRCMATYHHEDGVGLENYRFKVYKLLNDNNIIGEDYINGTIQSSRTLADGNYSADLRHVPVGTDINHEIIGKRIIIGSSGDTGRITNGDWGEIINYDKTSGLATLRRELNEFPSAGLPYTIELCERILLADSGNCYSYHLTYNFPLYVFNQKFQIETIMSSYEKQNSDTFINITVPEPALDFDYGQVNDEYSITVDEANQRIDLVFKDDLVSDNRFFALYRRESSSDNNDNVWEYLGFIKNGNSYVDYLAANNTTYDYLISRSVKYVRHSFEDPDYDPVHEYDFDPSVEYKAHEFSRAASTKWDGWSITAIYPCENDYTDKTIQSVREDDDHYDIRPSEYKVSIEQYACAKKPYKVGDTWRFYAAIDSGEILSNLNRTVHVGTSTYPSVTGTNNKYQSGTFTTDVVTLDCSSEKLYDNIEKINEWLRFITDDCLFILKSDKGDVWIVSITDNPSRSYDESVSEIITKVSYSWVEVDSVNNIQIVEY